MHLPKVCDLHIHIGASVAPHVMWSIAHQQGLKLPMKDYFEFVERITVDPNRVKTLDDYLHILHTWTEKIQSSPLAIERCVYEIIGKEYRSSHVSRIELRFNPMKRNVGGAKDLDHIIHAAVRGLNQASLEYGVEAGLILCLAREFPPEQNEIILNKAIKYAHLGIIGIDVAGTETQTLELNEQVSIYAKYFAKARAAGLGTTIHTGETQATSGEGVIAVLKHLRPHRIGHGIRAAFNDEAISRLADTGTVLEICPTSNLHTRAVSSLDDFHYIISRFRDGNVPFTINTDGTYLCRTNLQREFSILEEAGVLSAEEIPTIRQRAFEASFLER